MGFLALVGLNLFRQFVCRKRTPDILAGISNVFDLRRLVGNDFAIPRFQLNNIVMFAARRNALGKIRRGKFQRLLIRIFHFGYLAEIFQLIAQILHRFHFYMRHRQRIRAGNIGRIAITVTDCRLLPVRILADFNHIFAQSRTAMIRRPADDSRARQGYRQIIFRFYLDSRFFQQDFDIRVRVKVIQQLFAAIIKTHRRCLFKRRLAFGKRVSN